MRLPRWLIFSLDALTQVAAFAAASACAASALAPWGQATIFRNIDLHIPGAVYADGLIVLGASFLAILLRRSRIVGIIAALCMLLAARDAAVVIPRLVKSRIIAAQLDLFPINSVLDQAHLPDITVGNFNLPHEAYLDYGLLAWLPKAAACLLVASVLGLAFDPLVVHSWRRFGALRCPRCRDWIAVRRAADYCPNCGLWLSRGPEPLRCAACRSMLGATDNFCARCGLSVSASPIHIPDAGRR